MKLIAPGSVGVAPPLDQRLGRARRRRPSESSDPLKCGCFPDKNTTGCASTCTKGNGYDYGHCLARYGGVGRLSTSSACTSTTRRCDAVAGRRQRRKANQEVWQTEMSGVMCWPEAGAVAATSTMASRSPGGFTRRSWSARPRPGSGGGTRRAAPTTTKVCSSRAHRHRPSAATRSATTASSSGRATSGWTSRATPTRISSSRPYTGTDGTVVVVAVNKGIVGSHRADHHCWRDGTGLVHAVRDLVERQPRGRHGGGPGDGRELQRSAGRHDRHDVRLQVSPPPGGREKPALALDVSWSRAASS